MLCYDMLKIVRPTDRPPAHPLHRQPALSINLYQFSFKVSVILLATLQLQGFFTYWGHAFFKKLFLLVFL